MTRVLNAEERVAKEEAERKEEERLTLEQQDSFPVRGVQQVMDGRLEGKGEEEGAYTVHSMLIALHVQQ